MNNAQGDNENDDDGENAKSTDGPYVSILSPVDGATVTGTWVISIFVNPKNATLSYTKVSLVNTNTKQETVLDLNVATAFDVSVEGKNFKQDIYIVLAESYFAQVPPVTDEIHIQNLPSPNECVPSKEICDSIDNDCDMQTDEKVDVPDIITGSSSGNCVPRIESCIDGNYEVIQQGTPPGTDCNNTPKTFTTNIYFHSDAHDSPCSYSGNPNKGGMAALYTRLLEKQKEAKEKKEGFLYASSGDWFEKGSYMLKNSKGNLTISLIKMILKGLVDGDGNSATVFAFGDHEFKSNYYNSDSDDDGKQQADLTENIGKVTNIIGTTVTIKKNKEKNSDLIKKFWVKDMGPIRWGFVSYLQTEDTENPNFGAMSFGQSVDTVVDVATTLIEKYNINVLAFLDHSGIYHPGNKESWRWDHFWKVFAEKMGKKLDGIQIFGFLGNSHQLTVGGIVPDDDKSYHEPSFFQKKTYTIVADKDHVKFGSHNYPNASLNRIGMIGGKWATHLIELACTYDVQTKKPISCNGIGKSLHNVDENKEILEKIGGCNSEHKNSDL